MTSHPPLTFAAQGAPTSALVGHLRLGEGRHPDGRRLAADSRSLLLDGQRLLPVMGECHYARLPREEWPRALGALRAAGVDIVSTYVAWIHHEEERGQLDWSDRRDLRAFVLLARDLGVQVWLRPGPFVHGEIRGGGFPDWLCTMIRPGQRGNDPVYLAEVERWFSAVCRQVAGLLWRDGGPVVGVQLDNEFMHCGGRDGAAHLRELKRLALAAGLDAPWFTITGWGTPAFLDDEVLPVFGAYPDAPWVGGGNVPLPLAADYLFDERDRRMRASSSIGSDLASRPERVPTWDTHRQPFLTCELGPGNQIKAQRRPVIAPSDAVALAQVALGSGANLIGWYMFVGGENPLGRFSTLEEPGYPAVSYDFLAPLDESLRPRPVFHHCRVLHRCIATCGEALAGMTVVEAADGPTDPADVSRARVAVRSDGHSAFVFLSTCQRGVSYPPQRGVCITIHVVGREVLFPLVDLPSDTLAVWPCEVDLGGAVATWATAQPFAHLSTADGSPAWVFAATAGVPPALHLRGVAMVEHAPGWRWQVEDDGLCLEAIATGPEHAARLSLSNGETLTLIILDDAQARRAWILPVLGRERLLLSDAPLVYLDVTGDVICADLAVPMGTVSLWPDPGRDPRCAGHLLPRLVQGEAVRHPLPAAAADVTVTSTETRAATVPAHPLLLDHHGVRTWRLDLDLACLDQPGDLVLSLDLDGSIALLCAGDVVLTDACLNGETWSVGLRRHRDHIAAHGLKLHLSPLALHDAIHRPWERWPDSPGGSACALRRVGARFRPELRLTWEA